MPLVRISLQHGKPAAYRKAISDGVHQAMTASFNVPPNDRFQIITEHDAGTELVYDPRYLGIARSDDLVMIQITASNTRSIDQKRALYKRVAERLAEAPGLRPQDVLINLVEVAKENWSFGNGEAPYA